jgi:hypothetical protein
MVATRADEGDLVTDLQDELAHLGYTARFHTTTGDVAFSGDGHVSAGDNAGWATYERSAKAKKVTKKGFFRDKVTTQFKVRRTRTVWEDTQLPEDRAAATEGPRPDAGAVRRDPVAEQQRIWAAEIRRREEAARRDAEDEQGRAGSRRPRTEARQEEESDSGSESGSDNEAGSEIASEDGAERAPGADRDSDRDSDSDSDRDSDSDSDRESESDSDRDSDSDSDRDSDSDSDGESEAGARPQAGPSRQPRAAA